MVKDRKGNEADSIKFPIDNLTDEQVLREFCKRFQCDGAILMYLDQNIVYGFGRFRNKIGREWLKEVYKFHDKKRP